MQIEAPLIGLDGSLTRERTLLN